MRRPSLDAMAMGMLTRRPGEVASHLFWKCWRDECPQRAASLAYSTLLSLVPFLAVAFAILKGFGGLKPLQQKVETLIYTHLVTTSSWQAAEYIEKFTETVHAGAIGAVGFLGFVFTAVSLLNTVGSAFNKVWGVVERRTLKDRFVTFFTLTILGPVLFGASISITASIQQAAVWAWLPIHALGPTLGLIVPFLLTWAGILLLYVVIPSVPLRLRPALFGSLAGAGMWELLKLAFDAYVTSTANYGKIYASLAVIPVFLVWLYVSWFTALLGFEFAFFLQHPEMFRGPAPRRAALHGAVPAPLAVRAFVTVAESFARSTGPTTATQVADRLRLPEGMAFAALAELERKGFLARVAAPAESYLPSRTPTTIKVADLWRELGGGMGAADGDALARLLAGAAEATLRHMGPTTVQDLIDAGSPPTPAEAAAHSPANLTGSA